MCNENTRRRRKRGTEEIFGKKKMTEIFPKFMSDAKQQIQEDQQTSNRTNDHNIPSPGHKLYLGILFSDYRKPR